ncbi:hypothetical protein IQ266_19230 [filamentous cyanobacterium LEGE 11480]|uniref:Uncharacterized protein n=1 Tax=Romeriopsis navalis LEGE 11480 TaxID=2777977 RepID=A0A928VRY6_9CYAN|nr:hypothetical protein [Romeriopsis navalis]MBE9031871.1 hypothetical protein [Romeriopsis navalis LEGE 11480]
MLIRDLDFLQCPCNPQAIAGAVYTFAKAKANANGATANANAKANARGTRVTSMTETGVRIQAGSILNRSTAYAKSYAISRKGYHYSFSYDFDYDTDFWFS